MICNEYETEIRDTGNQLVMAYKCYCRTTGCLKQFNVKTQATKEITALHPIDRPCQNCGVPRLYENKNCLLH
jgi:hypothetical protein